MIRRYQVALLTCWSLAAFGQSAVPCHPISSDQISGSDLAAAVPQLGQLPADLKLGYAPAPGAQRIFRVAQLERLAANYGIRLKIAEPVCFAWPMHLLSTKEVAAAIRTSLAGRAVDLEITGQSQSPVPPGNVIFPLSGFTSGSSKATVWDGYVVYSGGRRFSTWVQVRISVHEKQIVATRAIRVGEVIDRSELRKMDYTGPLRHVAALHEEGEVAGKCARLPIAPETVLTASLLSLPLDVAKEQLVTVHIQCGAAHIETQGIARDGGYRGDVIRVRNPTTGRIFRARIDDKGMVTVVAGGSVGLVGEGQTS